MDFESSDFGIAREWLAGTPVNVPLSRCGFEDGVHPEDHLCSFRSTDQHLLFDSKGLEDPQLHHVTHLSLLHIWKYIEKF